MQNDIKKILEQIFQEEINEEFSKNTTDKWDSFTHLDILVELEKSFNISFTPQEMGAINSYKDIVDVVSKKIK